LRWRAVSRSSDSVLTGALHYAHPQRYAQEAWLANGRRFVALVERLHAEPGSHAAGVLDELMRKAGDAEALQKICAWMCEALP
jgi:hypothetical protein